MPWPAAAAETAQMKPVHDGDMNPVCILLSPWGKKQPLLPLPPALPVTFQVQHPRVTFPCCQCQVWSWEEQALCSWGQAAPWDELLVDITRMWGSRGRNPPEGTQMSRRNIPASSGRKVCIICSWRWMWLFAMQMDFASSKWPSSTEIVVFDIIWLLLFNASVPFLSASFPEHTSSRLIFFLFLINLKICELNL